MRFTDENHLLSLDNFQKASIKLGQYEDLDGKLGIEYPAIVEASEKGFYTKEFPEPVTPYVDFKNKCFIYILNFVTHKYYFKGYGKTWALTKEKLNEEKL